MQKNKVEALRLFLQEQGELDRGHLAVYGDLQDCLNRLSGRGETFEDESITYVFEEMKDMYWELSNNTDGVFPDDNCDWDTIAEELLETTLNKKFENSNELAQVIFDKSKEIILSIKDYLN